MKKKFIYWRNKGIAFSCDLCIIILAWLMAYWLRFDLERIPAICLHQALFALPGVVLLQSILFRSYGLYRGVWRFASIPDLVRIIKATLIGALVISSLFYFSPISFTLPRAVPLLYSVLLILGLSGTRIIFRWLKDYRKIFDQSKAVLIIGAGSAGEGLIRDLIRQASHLYHPVAIIDDNPHTLDYEIHGIPVVGSCDTLTACVKNYAIELIMIAVPSASAVQMRRIVALCAESGIPYRTLPGLGDLAEGKVNINNLREVALEDLLGRDPVLLDWKLLAAEFQAKTILVCGGGGSIGAELCRQLAQLALTHLLIIDHHEYNLYAIEMELKKKFPYLKLTCLLQDIKEVVGIQKIFSRYRPQIVFHAAAYKHVPLLESQCRAGVANNIIGTRILAEISVESQVKKFILISTDKAVNPTNIMGATKRAAEVFCQNFNEWVATEFITVRFGNVLDSAGSVVPLFRKQLQEGGPITVTHPLITRYFMTIPEATQLIMQAALIGQGGEIFVLDMGEPVKVNYLAEQLIRLSGKIPYEDIEIIYTGLRPGEKLYEELFHQQEFLCQTAHPKIMLSNARKVFWAEWLLMLEELTHACQAGAEESALQRIIQRMVPEYLIDNSMKKEAGADIIPLTKKQYT